MRSRLAFALLVVSSLASCVVEHTPDTPGNAAIQLMGAFQQGDEDLAATLLCEEITESGSISLEDPRTLGPLEPVAAMAANALPLGGESEYTVQQELDLDVDTAWTEIDFVQDGAEETWRLHMVRTDRWRACQAEARD